MPGGWSTKPTPCLAAGVPTAAPPSVLLRRRCKVVWLKAVGLGGSLPVGSHTYIGHNYIGHILLALVGLYLSAAAQLYRATNDSAYLHRASNLIEAVLQVSVVFRLNEAVCPILRGRVSRLTRPCVPSDKAACPVLQGRVSLLERPCVPSYKAACAVYPFLQGRVSLLERPCVPS